jgi:raffinose/stachyose/melibiose transport system permease protein
VTTLAEAIDAVTPHPGRAPRAGRLAGQNRMSWLTVILFLAPALVLYGFFVLYPIVQSTRYSLYDWNGLEPLNDFVGLDNFRRVFDDPLFRDALRHNVIIILLSLFLQIPCALGLAVLLNARLRGRALLRTLFFAPYVLSEVVTGVVWRQILRPDGLVDQILTSVGLDSWVHEWLADPGIVLYSLFFVISWKYFGFHMILLLAGLQQIPHELGEAASIDGATAWQRFRHVTLPLLGPSLRVSIFLSIIGALQLFDLVWVTTKGGPIGASSTMATYLYDQFRKSLFGYASAVSIVIFVLSLVVALLYQRFALRRDLRGTGLVG